MKRKIVHYLIALFLLTTIWKCATISTPQGGPKDVIPPTLLKSNPQQNQKNFKGALVELTFDEPLKLKDAREQILITPSPGKETNFIVKGSVLTIQPKNAWADSTTYSISFREGVQDLSEGNPVPNLRLAFSTGPILDSLTVAGVIKDALSEKIPENITVALYSTDTFNIFKHTPSYFTKAGKDGAFKIENLKPDNYLIYAFDDKNKNLRVDSPAETFGFLSDTLYLIKNMDGLSIPLIKIDTRELKLTSGRSIQDVATIKFNKSIISYKIEEEKKIKLANSIGDDQTQVSVYIDQQVKDSIKIRVQATDSLLQKVDTSLYIKRSATKRQPDPLKISFTEVELDSLAGELLTTFKSNKIINYFNLDSINLRIDSAQVVHFDRKDISLDTVFKKGIILKKVDRTLITSDRKKPYQLELGKDFACSIENDSIKAQKIPIKLLTFEETGTLSIELKNNTNYDLIVELVTAAGKPVRSVTNPKKYLFQNLIPDTYKLRIIHDKNCNAKWDFGNILLREEPEDISYYTTLDNKYDFPIRANWEVGPFKLTIDTPKGRPKDEKPPFLVKSSPAQNETNFKKSLIELYFDEPVKLKNPNEEIIISPSPGKDIVFDSHSRTIRILPKNGWKEGTTYFIYFREAVLDERGSNPASNLQLTFSTGSALDSLNIKGTVRNALSPKIPENITIALYSSDTFNIFKHKPQYFTKSFKGGRFKLSHVKVGDYFIYAFEDKNRNLKVDSETEAYGFLSTKIKLDKSVEDLTIPIFKIDSRKPKLISNKPAEDLVTLEFNKRLISYKITNKNKINLDNSFGLTRSQVLVYLNTRIKDSLKIQLQTIDSLNQKLDTSFFIKRTTAKRKRDPFSIQTTQAEIDSASGKIKLQVSYNKKFRSINYNSFSILLSNSQAIPSEQEDFVVDTITKSIAFSKTVEIKNISRNKKDSPKINIQKAFLTSIESDTLKAQRIPLQIINKASQGSITIQVSNPSNKNVLIDLLSSSNTVVQSTKDTRSFIFKNLPPDNYRIRITLDENNNEKWDFGNIFQRQEPEKIYFYQTPEKKSVIEIKDKPDPTVYQITI